MRIIAIANQKGGCGKTTSGINLAACLAALGQNTLLIDFDPQGHATLGLGLKKEEVSGTIYDALSVSSSARTPLSKITHSIQPHLHLIPSDILLTALEQELAQQPERELKLRKALCEATLDADIILIDCPPNLGLLTFNALCAAQEVIIPVEPSEFSLDGVARLLETLDLLEHTVKHKVMRRVLMTLFDSRTKFSRTAWRRLQAQFHEALFHTPIRHTVRLREAAEAHQSIVTFDPHSTAYADYLQVAQELIEQHPAAVSQASSPAVAQSTIERSSISASEEEVMPRRVLGGILFSRRAEGARTVRLVGDFTTAISDTLYTPLGGRHVWQRVYSLRGGRYAYTFVVNGSKETHGQGVTHSCIAVNANGEIAWPQKNANEG